MWGVKTRDFGWWAVILVPVLFISFLWRTPQFWIALIVVLSSCVGLGYLIHHVAWVR